MSFLERPPGDPPVDQTEEHEPPRSVGSRLTEFRERVARAFLGLDRGRVDQSLPEPGSREPGAETEIFDVLGEVPARTEDTRLPLGALGYNRAAVEARIAELEQEIGRQHMEIEILKKASKMLH